MARSVTRMTIMDAFHYTEAQRQELIAAYPKHTRRARVMGLPAIGAGAVFPIDDEDIICEPFDVPPHWVELAGIDFGWDHPTAAVRICFDRESETFYVTQEYRARELTPLQHVSALKGWGMHLPFAWGQEGLQTKLSDNPEQTQKIFRKHGLKMLDVHATFSEGGVGVEAGLQQILDLMMTGRFKIFKTCRMILEEKNSYHRAGKEGVAATIVKTHDDLIDAMRYAFMMRRNMVPVSWRAKYGGRPRVNPSAGLVRDTRDIFK